MAARRLDDIDVKILGVLQARGRLANVDLAGEVGLSPSACLRRVHALEADGFITGYAAQLDPKKLGIGVTVFVQVQIAQDNESETDAFREQMRQMPEVIDCFAVTGQFDYLLRVVAADLENYESFALRRLLRIPGVKDVRSCFVLDAVKRADTVPLSLAAPQ